MGSSRINPGFGDSLYYFLRALVLTGDTQPFAIQVDSGTLGIAVRNARLLRRDSGLLASLKSDTRASNTH
jgi:hypothetical protein